MPDHTPPHGVGKESAFATTSWSLIAAAAGREENQENAALALSELCAKYWMPLYAFARRRGYSSADAADLTQGFFGRVLEKHYLDDVDRESGRFRSFLLTAFRRFLSKEREYLQAAKRGGGRTIVSIDLNHAETQYATEPVDTRTPERVFERRWAIALLEYGLAQLESEYTSRGKAELFHLCRESLTITARGQNYAQIGATCGISEAAVKVAVHRMRTRFRELLRAEISRTVSHESDVDDELRALLRAVGN